MLIVVCFCYTLYYLIYNPFDIHGTKMNSIGLHWAFMKIHELGTKGYLKWLADKILNAA